MLPPLIDLSIRFGFNSERQSLLEVFVNTDDQLTKTINTTMKNQYISNLLRDFLFESGRSERSRDERSRDDRSSLSRDWEPRSSSAATDLRSPLNTKFITNQGGSIFLAV